MDPNAHFYETIARFYDAENSAMIEDLPLYSELAEESGAPILDVGCGTGRVTLALAEDGHRVIGIDHSEQMLARGRRKLESQPALKPLVTFLHGDVRTTALDQQFRMIIVPYNGLTQFITQEEQLAVLRRFEAALDPEGWLVLDLPNAGEAFGTHDPDTVALERMFVEPESGHMVMQQSVSTLNRVTQQLEITWIYDEIGKDGLIHRTLAPLTLRYIFPGEMTLMLAAAGLRAAHIYGDYDQSEFEDGSPRMIVLAEKASGQG